MRRQPPPLATWMLENLTLGERDEALHGDLIEEFQEGRPDTWYWRQVVAACAMSWFICLRRQRTSIAFAVVWSMLAPAWKVLCDQIQDWQILHHAWQMAGAFWILPAFALWLALHSIFLWTGILLYLLCFRRESRPETVRRAFMSAPLVFTPIVATVFVLMNLYSPPGLVNSRLAATPLRQILDLRMPADVLRMPFLIALLWALWGAASRSRHSSKSLPTGSESLESPTQSDNLTFPATFDLFVLRRFLGYMVVAGLTNAMIAALVLCRLPASHRPGLGSLLIRATFHVSAGVLAGAAGTWLYWKILSSPFRESAQPPFPLFALICASGWVWVPSMVIFSERLSTAAAFVAMIGAFALSSGLRNTTAIVFAPAPRGPSLHGTDHELFAESLNRPPVELDGYGIAIALYAAAAALITHSIYTAAVVLACTAFLFAWKRVLPPNESFVYHREIRRAALRLAWVTIPAVFVTIWALSDGVGQHNLLAPLDLSTKEGDSRKSSSSAHQTHGYESVILWPYPEKKQFMPPIPQEDSLLTPGAKRSVIIHFDGAYWYLQPPAERPGTMAHQARGTPVSVDIKSNNSNPLLMRAHQRLSAEVLLAHCREIDIGIENRDDKATSISLALLLTDGRSPQKRTLYLGERPVVSTQTGHASFKRPPAFETLRFSVPARGEIRKFSEITVLMLPDIEHSYVAPKIAILQFQLFPR
jgi:hypothetical protein